MRTGFFRVFLVVVVTGQSVFAQETCIPIELVRRVDRALEIGEEYASPGHGIGSFNLLYLEPAEALRREADRMDRHEADYLFLQEAVQAWKEHIGAREVQVIGK